MPDELETIFPNLAGVLRGWDSPHVNNPAFASLHQGGEGIAVSPEADAAAQQAAAQVLNRTVNEPPRFVSGRGAPTNSLPTGVEGTTGAPNPPQPAVTPQSEPPTSPGGTPSAESSETSPQADQGQPGAGDELGDEGSAEGGEGDDGTPPPPPPSGIDPSILARYAEFDEVLKQNPGLREHIASFFTGQRPTGAPSAGGMGVGAVGQGAPAAPTPSMPTPPTGLPTEPPPDLDMDDPSIRAIWTRMQAQQQYLDTQFAQLQQMASMAVNRQIETERQQQAVLLQEVTNSFKTAHSLNDDEVNRVAEATSRLGILPGLLQPVDPVTGLPRQVDTRAAVLQALEAGYSLFPELRNRDAVAAQQRLRQETQRKQKAGALAGSSGSVPRTTPQPRNPQERHAAMVDEVRSMMNGEWEGQ